MTYSKDQLEKDFQAQVTTILSMIPLSHLSNLVPKKGEKVLELTHLAPVNTVFLAV
jgi:hypothetical protein